IDSGIFQAIQFAGITALKTKQSFLRSMSALYEERRDVLISGLRNLGWEVSSPKATFYVWTKVPQGRDSISFSNLMMEKADIVTTPGVGFGKYGEGYVRFALTQDKLRIKEAVKRLSAL
ncbi:MAG: aminotransferase class I/II-fold pyridoxal phosphate-dependent enzyme, partial [Candidatus Omnitrophica bacterium]|nr:aminotransferase class I/II-fold pyridoxal phosphate-dependent enzyme [Candidatus Omnitrophota bacterium]